jgi:hypothetical protein
VSAISRPTIMIFCVCQASQSYEVNMTAYWHVVDMLRMAHVPFTEVSGVYKGVSESSIMVSGLEHIKVVEELCAMYGRECYMVSYGNDRYSELVYMSDKRREPLGTLVRVEDENVATLVENADAYTYNPVDESFWVTRL